ncbi:hypothetical protein DEO72_LG7g713 [Vigna unguiculata]|uniref:Uncharacterized protein n=1 Tax=Vigna unguiculata TaxID=3917 RepID=A0A4D6MDB5_VIGUN|nr:hypothetical protein DEO72_LG7g713 [Vigna unguiculata]
MSGEVHIQLLSCGDTSEVGSYVPCSHLRDVACGEVRNWWITCVRLRAGRSVEQDYKRKVRRAELRTGRFVEAEPLAGSSSFLFVIGDDRVIRYTGADDATGDVVDA